MKEFVILFENLVKTK